MEYLLCIVAFTMLWKITLSIECYRCIPEDKLNGIPLCMHFDYSAKFLFNCSTSNMCFKRQTTYDLSTGSSYVSVSRGCAPQTLPGYQEKINNKWQLVNKIYDAYDEGCQEDRFDEQRLSKVMNCYCRGDRCNSSHIPIIHFTAMLLFFSILKLLS